MMIYSLKYVVGWSKGIWDFCDFSGGIKLNHGNLISQGQAEVKVEEEINNAELLVLMVKR
jgi:hypothetical protein